MAKNDSGGASKASETDGNRPAEQGKAANAGGCGFPHRLVAVSWRDLLVIGLPVLLITAVAAWIADFRE